MTNCVQKERLSVTKRTKIGGLSVKYIMNKGFQDQNGKKFLNISSNVSKFSKNQIFLPKIVTCLTIKCEYEGSLSDKDVSGSFGDKEFVKDRGPFPGGHWVKVGKNEGVFR